MLEFNVRFGDPETQVVLPRFVGDLTATLAEVASGDLRTVPTISDQAAVCVVMAAEGYPGSPRRGDRISGLPEAQSLDGVTVFHAGTGLDAGQVGDGRWAGPRRDRCRADPRRGSPSCLRRRGVHPVARCPLPDRHCPGRNGAGDGRRDRDANDAGDGGRSMIPRYSPPAMAALFTDEARLAGWLEVELLATEGWADIGVVPRSAADVCRSRAPKVGRRLRRGGGRTGASRPTTTWPPSSTSSRRPSASPKGRGSTTGSPPPTWSTPPSARPSPGPPTSCSWPRGGWWRRARQRATETIDVPIVGRTHGMHAEPTTYGTKFALWALQADRDRQRLEAARGRVAVGKLSGAVGTYSNIDPRVEAHVCRGARPRPGAGHPGGRP